MHRTVRCDNPRCERVGEVTDQPGPLGRACDSCGEPVVVVAAKNADRERAVRTPPETR